MCVGTDFRRVVGLRVRAGIVAASAGLERFVLIFGEDVGRDKLSTDHEREDVETPTS